MPSSISEPVFEYASRAMYAALAEDYPAASRWVQRLADHHGAVGVTHAIIAWCDTYCDHATEGTFTQPVDDEILVMDEKTGGLTNHEAAEVEPAVRWSAQVIGARASMNMDAFRRAMVALGDADNPEYWVMTCLVTIAHTVNGFPRGFGVMGADLT